MVQFFTRHFYAPFLVSADGSAVHGTFELAVINDEAFGAPKKGTVELTMRSWRDGPLKTWSVSFVAAPGSATRLVSSSFVDMLAKGGCDDATRCVLTYRAVEAGTNEVLSTNYLLLSPFYDVVTMRRPQLQVGSVVKVGGAPARGARPGEVAFDVNITSSGTAAFVWAETAYAGRWSDNALLLTEPSVTLTFYHDTLVDGPGLTPDALAKSFEMNSGTGTHRAGQGGLWSLADTSNEYTAQG